MLVAHQKLVYPKKKEIEKVETLHCAFFNYIIMSWPNNTPPVYVKLKYKIVTIICGNFKYKM